MNISTNNIKLNLNKSRISDKNEKWIEQDIIVPDNMPDAVKIINISSIPYVNDVEINNGRAKVVGKINYSVTYRANDEQMNIRGLNVSYPYTVNIENNIEQTKELTSPQYISGRYVKYTQNGNTLYLKDDCRSKVLNLLYYENIVDDNDLPQITYKEALAIATYVAQVGMFKKAIATNNSALMQMSQVLERKTAYYIDQARVPDSISQNEMNEILDVKASYDRKVYGKSYKPIK